MRKDRCVVIPVSLAGQVTLWLSALGLMIVGTMADSMEPRAWGLFLSAAAASWTIVSAVARQHDAVLRAFELGRAAGEGERTMRPV